MEIVSTYQNLHIYYFSGTGNARRTALRIADVARKSKINVHAIDISKKTAHYLPTEKGRTLIGFCSPTHGFNLPPIMLHFIFHFPRVDNSDAFILNTRGRLKIHKLFTPGLSGIAQLFPALILKIKGISTVGFQPLDMPSNWISLHPGIRTKVISSIIKRCDKITDKFASKIIRGNKIYKGLLSLPLDILISPISVLYYIIGRFAIAKTFYATDSCNMCGLCEKNCPVHAIIRKREIMYWKFTCESCMKCMNNCPERAIETSHTFTALIWIFVMSILPSLANTFIYKSSFLGIINDTWYFGILSFVFETLAMFLVIWAAYEIFHFLLKNKTFNKIAAYSSLTKYKFWRRYKHKTPMK